MQKYTTMINIKDKTDEFETHRISVLLVFSGFEDGFNKVIQSFLDFYSRWARVGFQELREDNKNAILKYFLVQLMMPYSKR